MKHIKLDGEDEHVKRFLRTLLVDPEGSILELAGEALLKVLPIDQGPVYSAKLRAGILKRRKRSRKLNEDWAAVDEEVWNVDAMRSADQFPENCP